LRYPNWINFLFNMG